MLNLFHNGILVEDEFSFEGGHYSYNNSGTQLKFNDEMDPPSVETTIDIIYTLMETLYPDVEPFDLPKNQTITTNIYNHALSVTVTDDEGLNVTIAKGQANYPYNGQLILVFQNNQLVLQANDRTRKVYVKGNKPSAF